MAISKSRIEKKKEQRLSKIIAGNKGYVCKNVRDIMNRVYTFNDSKMEDARIDDKV